MIIPRDLSGQVDIRMFLIEVKHVGRVFEGTLEELQDIMFSNG